MPEFSLLRPGASSLAIENDAARGDIVIVCEHASRLIPAALGCLGLDTSALESHIAWDPGALGVSRYLSSSLDALLCYQRYSRLVYDCNRPPEAASAIVGTSEIYDVPGNQDISQAERVARVNEIYLPFRDGISEILASRKAQGRETMLVTVHSFTPSISAESARSRSEYCTTATPGSRTQSSPGLKKTITNLSSCATSRTVQLMGSHTRSSSTASRTVFRMS